MTQREKTKIGLYRIHKPEKGLWRDSLAIIHVLQQLGFEVSTFDVGRLGNDKSMDGRLLAPWRDTLDAVVLFELFQGVYDKHFLGMPTVYIPNLDWAATFDRGPENVQDWVRRVKGAAKFRSFQVWAKTRFTFQTLSQHGVMSRHIQWALPDEPIRQRKFTAHSRRAVRFYLNAGHGGYQGRRGVDVALNAFNTLWNRNLPRKPELLVKLVRPLAQVKHPRGTQLLKPPGTRIINENWSRERLRGELLEHDVALMPSRFEGLGLTMLEALHASVPVIATDMSPLNEYVLHETNGLLFPGKTLSPMRLAQRTEPSPAALADAMERLVLTAHQPDGLLARLTENATVGLSHLQQRFTDGVRTAMKDLLE